MTEFSKNTFFKTHPLSKDFRWLLWGIGIIYFWFGSLKIFPYLSPAEVLAQDTIKFITFGLIPVKLGYYILAVWELVIGVMFLLKRISPALVWLTLMHMFGTLIPMLVFLESCYQSFPFVLTLVGQYIIKNILIIAVLFYILKRLEK